jgi:hypothetical protein
MGNNWQKFDETMQDADALARRHRVEDCDYCNRLRAEGASSFAPYHDASPRCESGKRNHCTCATCF